jgi:Protein of unknown function (DUF1566)
MSKRYKGGVISATAPTTSSSAATGIWTLEQQMQAIAASNWPATPGAPTIGTATAVTSTTASVAFTAPSDLGSGTVTFTATSSPSGITGTGASPITVSGLIGGTSYTFTVTAATPGGTSPASAASNSITTTPVIGQAFGGGFFAGQISTAGNGIADYNLTVGPVASAQSNFKKWKIVNTTTAGTSSVIDGPANSTAMNDATHPAAQFCEGLTIGGFSDWYMPAKNELEVCYYNLKPTTTSNNTLSGTNTNAVPSRGSNYTAGTPAQTSATDFKDTGAEAFAAVFYWSSTEFDGTFAWGQNFDSGRQYYRRKYYNHRVRAVRRVAV